MFSINMLNGLFDPIINWFSSFLYYVCVGLYYIIICGVGKLIDIIQILFRKFAGIDDMSLAGQEGDIVLQFINSDIVQKVFWAMVVLAVVLLFIASFVAVIKTEFNKDGKNDKKKIIKNAFRGIVNFLAVPVVCVFGLIVGNALLRAIDGALTQNGNSLSMTSQIFAAGGYNANRVRSYEGTGDNAYGYAENSMAYYIATGYGNFGIFTEDTTGVAKQSIADKIDSAFANNLTVNLDDKKERTLVYAGGENGDYAYTYVNYFSLGAFPWGHTMFNDEYVDGNRVVIIGDGSGAIQESTETLTFSIYNIGLVSYYYDLSLASYDYLIAGVALIFAAWVYLQTILGLIKRLFMLTTLFIISPPICALYPLDEGAALGKWRKEFVSQALSAYSVVIVMNIFFLLLPLLLQIQIIPVGTRVEIWEVPVGFINYIARLLIIIAALLFFKDATKTIASIIGSESAYDTGSGKSSAVASRVVGGAYLAGHMIGGIVRHRPRGDRGPNPDGPNPSQQDIDNTANSDAAGKFAGSTNIDNKNAMNSPDSKNPDDGKLKNSKNLIDSNNASNSKDSQVSDSENSGDGNGNETTTQNNSTDGKAKKRVNKKAIVKGVALGLIAPVFGAGYAAVKGVTFTAHKISSKIDEKKTNKFNELTDDEKKLKQKKSELKTQKSNVRKATRKKTRKSFMNALNFAGSGALAIATGAKVKDYKNINKTNSEKYSEISKNKSDIKEQKQQINQLKSEVKELKKNVKNNKNKDVKE